MDEITDPRYVEFFETIWSPNSDHTESTMVLPPEYWERFPNIPTPSEKEIEELINIQDVHHVFIFYRNKTIIVVPMPDTIKGDSEVYEEPIKAIRRLIEIQAKERTMLGKTIDILNMHDVDELIEEHEIDLAGAVIASTYSEVGIEVLAKTIGDFCGEDAFRLVEGYHYDETIGPKTPVDAVLSQVQAYITKDENSFVDLIAFGEQGLYMTKLGQMVEDKMDEYSYNYDEVVHVLSEWYTKTLNAYIDELVDSKFGYTTRVPVTYAGVLSPKSYNYKTDQLIVKGGELSLIHKAIVTSKNYYKWLEHVREVTTRTEDYIPYHEGKDFDRHISKWSKAQKSSLLSFCARLADEEGVFEDMSPGFDEQVTSDTQA